MFKDKRQKLFLILAGIFITNALNAEFIGVKIFSVEKTLGFAPLDFSLLGIEHMAFNMSAGVLLWPIVFVLTDVINEYFGKRGIRFLSYMVVALILYAFVMIYLVINLDPANFWLKSHIAADLSAIEKSALESRVGDYDYAFKIVFGQGLWIIVGSMVAFLLGQILDVMVFHRIKKWTGEKKVWLRATGSTFISQFVDSFVVLFIAFYIGAGWSLELFLAVGLVNYTYKFIMAILLTPLIYLAHYLIDAFLGKELANKLKAEAAI